MTKQPTLDEFETRKLLDAVDDLDNMRGILADGDHCRPPQVRIDLLKLHDLAMTVCNYSGTEDKQQELFEAASDIEDAVQELHSAAERIISVLQGITLADIEGSEDWY